MSQRNVFTLEDFNKAYKKWKGECIVFDPENFKALKAKKGSKDNYDVTYLPTQFKDVDGKIHAYPKFAYKAFVCAQAKAPHGVNHDQIKHVNLTFRDMSMTDLEGGDYVPKKLLIPDSTKDKILTQYMTFQSGEIKLPGVKKWLKKNLEHRPSMKAILKKIDQETSVQNFKEWLDGHAKTMITAQEKENQEMKEWITEYMGTTKEFIKTLDNMNDAFKKMCKRLIKMGDNEELAFDVQKDSSATGPPKIGTIKQSEKVEGKGKNKKTIKFDHALYRTKLAVNKKDGQIGNYNYTKGEIYHTVFDARMSNKNNDWAAVPARVFEKNKKGVLVGRALTWRNVGKFITYKSLIDGQITFKEATMSKSGGISSKFENDNCHVLRHKPGSSVKKADATATQRMRRDECSSDEEEEDMGQEAPSKSSHDVEDEEEQEAGGVEDDVEDASSEGEPPSDDEPVEEDPAEDTDVEEEEEAPKPKPKKSKGKKKK